MIKKVVLLLLLCLIPSLSHPAFYYADKDGVGGTGSDSNNCTALATPCKTINGALGKVTGSQANTIFIRSDGDTEYSEYINPTSTKNGIEGGFLTIQGYQSEDPTIVGTLAFTGSWSLSSGSTYVTANNSVTYTPKMYVVTCGGTERLMCTGSAACTATSAASVNADGEWWYDTANQKVYARVNGGVDPDTCTNHRLTNLPTGGETWNALFYLASDYTLIQNLNIKYSNAGGIFGGQTAGVQGQFQQVKNVDVDWTYQAGIKSYKRDYSYFYNNTVNHAVVSRYIEGVTGKPEPINMQNGTGSVADSNTVTNAYFMGCPSGGDSNDNISINNTCNDVDHFSYPNRNLRSRWQNNIAIEGGDNIKLSPEPSTVDNNKYNTFIGNRIKGGTNCVRLLTYGATPNKSYNNLLAHNTCYDTDKGIWSQNTSTTIYDNEFKNNIIFGYAGNPVIMVQNANPSDNVWSYNLHYSDAVLTKYYDQAGVTYQNANGQTAFNSWKAAMSPQAQNDIWGNPNFVDLTDFVLQAGSPAINAGTGLTTVTTQAGTCTAGSSTTIKVANADWFHGPWGDDGSGDADPTIIAGDSIRVYTPGGGGTDQTRTVSSVSYAANEAADRAGTITVTSALSCAASDIVDFAAHFIGTAPDMGAEEYDSGVAACNPPTLNAVTTPTGDSSQNISGNKDANCSVLLNSVEIMVLDATTAWGAYSMALSVGVNNISLTSKNSQGTESSATTGSITRIPPPAG